MSKLSLAMLEQVTARLPMLVESAESGSIADACDLLTGVVAYCLVLFTMVVTSDASLFPTLLLIGALIIPLTVLCLVNWRGLEPIVPLRVEAWWRCPAGCWAS